MPFVPTPNVVMLEFRYLQAAQKIENRLMVDMLATPTNAAMSDLLDLAEAWAESVLFLQMTDNVSLVEVVATDLTTINGAQLSKAPVVPIIGGLGTNAMPNETSFCISLRSASRGRSARGRWYMAGVDKGVCDDNVVTDAYRSNSAEAIEQLVEDITLTGVVPVIVSYRSNKVPRPGGPVYFPITNVITVDNILDSMRRRKPGVGT